MLKGSDLLEVALDYHLALSVYVTLMATLQKSAQMMVAPKDTPKTVTPWDDGLSGVR